MMMADMIAFVVTNSYNLLFKKSQNWEQEMGPASQAHILGK